MFELRPTLASATKRRCLFVVNDLRIKANYFTHVMYLYMWYTYHGFTICIQVLVNVQFLNIFNTNNVKFK